MSRYSVKRPFTVVVCVLIVLILGYESFTKLSTDLLPSMNLPYAIVVTTYPGANPETVEAVVTSPIESSMSTISNIKNVSSVSADNYSMVILEFNQNANMDSVTIDMRESLDLLKTYWPDSVANPMIMKLNPDMLPVMMLAVDRDGADVAEISDFINDTLLNEMKSLDGVASVTASGLIERSLKVTLDQDKIDALNERLMSQLDASFDEARDQIEDGRSQLEAGKEALDEQAADATRQMLDASSAITSGKIEISENESQLNASLAEIEKGEAELDQKEAELEAAREKLEENADMMEKLEARLAEFQETLESGKKRIGEIETELEQLKAEDEEGNAARITLLEAEKTTLERTIEAAETGLKALKSQGVAVGATEEARKQIEAGQAVIDQTREQLAAGKAQIQSALAQLETAKGMIVDQEAQLNAAQAAASGQLQDARIQIVTGQQQLDGASEQLEQSVDEAREKADLTGLITRDMVSGILTAQNFSMPAGYVTEDKKDYLVRVGDEMYGQEELENLVLFDLSDYDMGQICVKDVAEVELATDADTKYAKINGNDGIILSLEKQNGYSTADVARRIRDYLTEAQEKYEGLHMTALMDQGIYIDLVIKSVLQNLIVGAVLAIIVLIFFLKDLRSTLTVAISIPVSVVFAIVLMYFSGISMNIISLSGLALGVGMLVDNAIVVIENIYRLRLGGMAPAEAAVDGTKQVGGAIIASTLTTICIWVPIVFAEGITRQLFQDMVLTIAYSLFASLIVALTVVPMTSSRLMTGSREIRHPFFDRVTQVYGRSLEVVLRHKLPVLALVLLLFVGTTAYMVRQGLEFMGETDSDQMTISVQMPEGSDFSQTAAMSDTIVDRVQAVDEVETVGAIMGSSLNLMGSFGGTDTENISMYVVLKEDRERSSQEVASDISERLKDLDCEASVSGSSMDMSALGGSGVSVMVKGRDLDTLMTVAKDLAGILESVEGTVEVSDGIDDPTAELRITVDKNKAMAHSLTIAQIFQELNTKLAEASQTTTLSVNQHDVPVIVINGKDSKMTPEDIRTYTFEVTDVKGETSEVKLSDIAEIETGEALSAINRDGQQRYITVSAGVDEAHNVTLVTSEFEEKLNAYEMPEGCSYEVSGENETIMDAMRQLGKLLAAGILIMYLIMVAQFQSFLSPFIVLFTLPLAFTGGFLALMLSGNIISVIAMVGFVMLCGIIVNNGIVFVDYVNQLREGGMKKKAALVETGQTRLRPILMTALTTILAMSTMALGIGDGTDMIQPMAIVTIGGLVYGTLMTLYVVPCIYDLFRREKKEMKEATDHED